MKRNNKTAVDVASLVGLKDPRPVTMFLQGKTEPRHILMQAFERLITQNGVSPGPKVA